MINYERVAEKIFSIIKGHGHTLSMYKEDGMDTTDAAEARRFFVAKPNYMITLDEQTNTIKVNKNSNLKLEDFESIMKQMKNLARENMLNTQVKVFGKEITPKDFAYQAKKFKDNTMESYNTSDWLVRIYNGEVEIDKFPIQNRTEQQASKEATHEVEREYPGSDWTLTPMHGISEASLSRMSGSKKTSYQTLESVKMIVRHRKAVDEDVRGSRSRQIKAIFLEQAGERFRFPHNCLPCARAMARHMYEGGNMQDTIGEYIIESSANLIKLNEFVRYARTNKLMNEANEDVVKTVRENIATIRNEFKGLTGAKSYARVSEAISAREASVLEEDDTTDLQDMFTVRKFDEKISGTLPLVRRLMNEKQIWRDALVEASQQTIYMTAKEELAEEDIMEFDSPVQQVGYKIGKIAKRMVESGDLSNFVSKVAGKLIEGEKISDFEKTIVRNVMENAKITEECKHCGHDDCDGHCDEAYDEPTDTVESIGDQFELKMKMIEHEEIFTEGEERPYVCHHNKKGEHECNADSSYGAAKKAAEAWGLNSTAGVSATLTDVKQSTQFVGEDGSEKCIRCRKGTMHLGDTMMGPAKQCDRCGYQQQINEEEFDDHHAGEIEAGAHSGMPSADLDDCDTCGGWGFVSSTGKSWRDTEPSDPDTIPCPDCRDENYEPIEDDGQPSEYDEWQDFHGGDDWDHGQYDESIAEALADESDECKRCFGLGRAPSGGKDCDVCKGTGKDNRATCEWCQGTGSPKESGGYDDLDDLGLCSKCDGSGKASYDKGSRQDPFGGNYNVGVEDFMEPGESDTIF